MVTVQFAAPLGLSDVDPVGSLVAGAGEALGLDEGFQQNGSVSVAVLPVLGELTRGQGQIILYADDVLADPAEPVSLGVARGEIEFRGVDFHYTDEPVLHNVNQRIPAGQIVALVGPSGAGKTSFANLIPRLYDVRAGQVLIDGIDVRHYRKGDLRDQISIVAQDAILFNDTVRNNILIGRSDATDEDVVQAANQAFAHDFIESLEHGYDTVVGERGTRLSGGQQQRIALARAFLKNAPILILDEATSHLDSQNEAMIQEALASLIQGRTTLIIAHRFSTLKIAQRILLFDDGKIVAAGSKEELFANNTRYRTLYDLQRDLKHPEKPAS